MVLLRAENLALLSTAVAERAVPGLWQVEFPNLDEERWALGTPGGDSAEDRVRFSDECRKAEVRIAWRQDLL